MLEQNSMLQNLFNWFIALGFSIDMFVHPFGSRIWMLWCGTWSGQESIYHASDSWILSISLRLLHDDLIHFVSYFDWSKFPSWIEYGASSFLLFPHLSIYFRLDSLSFPSYQRFQFLNMGKLQRNAVGNVRSFVVQAIDFSSNISPIDVSSYSIICFN